MLGLGLGLGAVRLFPLGEFVAGHPRVVKDWDYTWPQELLTTYGQRYGARAFGHHQYVFPEFGNYFGWLGVGLMLAGLFYVVARRRRALLPIVAGAVTFVVFQLGNLVPLPWWLLRHLPVFNHLRVPSRFTIVAGMFMCVLIGVAVDTWGTPALAPAAQSPRRRALGVGVLALALAFLFDAASWNRLQLLPTLGAPAPRDAPAAQFHQVPGDRGRMLLYPRLNEGSLSYFEESPLDVSPRLRANLPADEYLAEPDAGSVHRRAWTPNRIELDVDVSRPATVLVNQNFAAGWRVDGGELVSEGGLLAARVPAGRRTLTFRYLPGSLLVGAAVSALALAVAIALVVTGRRRRAS